MAKRLTLIDKLTRPDHWYLTEEDTCYYYGEYTARKGYAYSETNQLILNLKKSVNRVGRPEYAHKIRAISTIANILERLIKPEEVTFVPVPPSKVKSDPLYDDRLVTVLQSFKESAGNVDCRELIVQRESTQASHHSDDRLSPDDLIPLYEIDESLTGNIRKHILVFDDVITTGSHFKAMQSVLSRRFPGHPIVGIFIARRVPEAEDPRDIFSAFFENDD